MEKLYIKEINGEVKILPKYKIVIETENSQTFDPSEEMLFDNGWIVYEEPAYEPVVEEKTVESVKRDKIWEVRRYDKSNEINTFFLNGERLWFNKSERMNLKFKFEIEKEKGIENTTIWFEDKSYTIPVDYAICMISELELYASQCFNVTKEICNKIDILESIEEVEAFDYVSLYPNVLSYEY